MDISYVRNALQRIRGENNGRPWQYDEVLDWVINYIDSNWDDLDELLDEDI